MNIVTLRLPWPPTVNHYYGRTRTGRVYLKETGRLYRRRAALEFARLGWPRLEGKVSVNLILAPPDRRKRDIDNVRKAVYDAISDRRNGKTITHTGIIPDDANIREDSAQFAEPGEGWVNVTISVLSANKEPP